MHKFFHFAHLKSTFSILHNYFYKTPTSVCLFYTFIQIKYSFLYPHSHRPTPVSHRNPHNPPVTNPANQKNKPSNKIDAPGINTTQQHNPHNPATRNRNKPSNTIHTTHPKSTPHLEQQDRRLQWRWREWETRLTPPKASSGNGDGNGDGERHSTRNPLIKSPFNPKTTRNKGRKSDRRWRWRSTAAMGRKIDKRKKDWSDERKKERAVHQERERGSCELV